MSQNAPREKPHATRGGEGGTQRPVSPTASSPPQGHAAAGTFRGTLRAGVSREGPRETLFAAGEGKGDGFGAESVALAGFRGSGGRGVPAARVVSS